HQRRRCEGTNQDGQQKTHFTALFFSAFDATVECLFQKSCGFQPFFCYFSRRMSATARPANRPTKRFFCPPDPFHTTKSVTLMDSQTANRLVESARQGDL